MRARVGAVVPLVTLLLGSCAAPRREPVTVVWVVGQTPPGFEPQAPPDPVRWAIERLLTRGLVEEDSSGQARLAAAESLAVSDDGLVYTFRLRPRLSFADGSPCSSAAFRRALVKGLNHPEHSTFAWLLSAIEGMDRVRAGKPLPPLGIETPDPRTLILRLARPDSLLLRKLSLPGVATPWRPAAAPGGTPRQAALAAPDPGDGIGDYRVAVVAPTRVTLVRRADRAALPDTIQVRFVPSAARVRVLLRAGVVDLLWPAPPDLLERPLPQGYETRTVPARPARNLLLVMRADLPPTSRPAARHALTHGLNPGELLAALQGQGAEPAGLAGSARFDFPSHDPQEVQAWLERGKLGRSLHVVMAYSQEGPADRVARAMQVEWARAGLDVELRPLRQPAMMQEAVRRGGAQLLLVESQALLDRPQVELASLVLPMRGPPVGSFRTGWMTREFDRWIQDGDAPLPAVVQQRLAEERIVLPLARLPWLWVDRSGSEVPFHPRYGPEPASVVPAPPSP
jgi:ABC-type transport system substrate-binding protein